MFRHLITASAIAFMLVLGGCHRSATDAPSTANHQAISPTTAATWTQGDFTIRGGFREGDLQSLDSH